MIISLGTIHQHPTTASGDVNQCLLSHLRQQRKRERIWIKTRYLVSLISFANFCTQNNTPDGAPVRQGSGESMAVISGREQALMHIVLILSDRLFSGNLIALRQRKSPCSPWMNVKRASGRFNWLFDVDGSSNGCLYTSYDRVSRDAFERWVLLQRSHPFWWSLSPRELSRIRGLESWRNPSCCRPYDGG